jgi:serine/threonine-protein kinase
VARAPDDPMILSGYALAHLRRFSQDPEADLAERAGDAGRAAAERALAIAPHLGEARVALAQYKLAIGDAVAAAHDVREALRVAPGYPDAHDMHGRLLIEVGRPEQGIACLRTAAMLEPTLTRALADVVRVKCLLGDYGECDTFFANVPAEHGARNTFWFFASRIAAWRGDERWTRDLRTRAAASAFPLQAEILGILDAVLARAPTPQLRAGLELWGRVTGRSRRRPMFFRQLVAELSAFMGDTDAALTALEGGDSLGLIDVVWVDRCPLFGGMRGEPRFLAVRGRLAARADAVLRVLSS